MNVRAQAALTLAPVLRGERSLQRSFDSAVSAVTEKDRALFHELVFGCLRHYEWLAAVSKILIKKKLKSKDQDIAALVLIGLYQLHFLRVPDHAAISETVDATKRLKKHWAKGLVNASLRNFTRQKDALSSQISGLESAQARLPEWMLKCIKHDWPEHLSEIVEAMQNKAPITLRNNIQRQTRTALGKQLSDSKIEFEFGQFCDESLSLVNSADINRLKALDQGCASVQDEAAQLSAFLLDLKPGQRVLDACAAPGGKSCHILENQTGIHLTALELEPERSALIDENLKRLGLQAEVLTCDAAQVDSWWDGELYDRILLDAPCSALGVMRRHPDIKLLRRETDLVKLVASQKQLLQNVWPCLAPGGMLVYATCSILKMENEAVVAEFCEHTGNAEHREIQANWGHKRAYGRQLFPRLGGHDGFYYATLHKLK